MRSDLFVCGLKLMQHRELWSRCAEMQRAELRHECLPHARAAFLQQLRADRQLLGDRRVAPAPGADLREEGHELDGRLGQAVDRLLLVAGIVAPA